MHIFVGLMVPKLINNTPNVLMRFNLICIIPIGTKSVLISDLKFLHNNV